MNERTRRIQSIMCSLCKGLAWHSSHQPVCVGVAWHHPSCRNVIGLSKVEELTFSALQGMQRRRPRALRR